MLFTQPTLIVSIENKTTKKGNPYLSIKTQGDQKFNCFQPGDIDAVRQLHTYQEAVVIGYEMNGQYTDFKNINRAVQGPVPNQVSPVPQAPPQTQQYQTPPVPQAPPQTPQNAPQATMDKEESIARAVALKAAVELVDIATVAEHFSGSLTEHTFKIADKCLAWLKNETLPQPAVPPSAPAQDEILMEDIPF